MAEDLEAPIGAPVADDNDDENAVRRPQHLKRDDPRAKEIEGTPVFKVNEEEARPMTAKRAAAKKRSK